MTHLDLFSGIGGFSEGLKRSGIPITKTYFAEIDSHAIAVYKHNFKNSTHVKSVTDVRGSDLGKIDIITFGSPCQDFSLAGKREGLNGGRSSLILEAIRLVRECRPSVFIWENVKGTFSSNNREDFAAILQAFANLGIYRLEWQLLNTKWFLPQNRERVYLVGYLGGGSGPQVFPISEGSGQTNELQRQQGNICTLTTRYGADGNGSYIIERKQHAQEIQITDKRGNIKADQQNMPTIVAGYYKLPSDSPYIEYEAGTLRTHKDGRGFRRIKDGDSPTIPARARQDGSGQPVVRIKTNNKKGYEDVMDGDSLNYTNPASKTRRGRVGKGVAQTLDTGCEQAVAKSDNIRRLTPIECERLQGFDDNWTRYGDYDGVVKEVSDTQRYKMCGNAVTVDVVQAVANKIHALLK